MSNHTRTNVVLDESLQWKRQCLQESQVVLKRCEGMKRDLDNTHQKMASIQTAIASLPRYFEGIAELPELLKGAQNTIEVFDQNLQRMTKLGEMVHEKSSECLEFAKMESEELFKRLAISAAQLNDLNRSVNEGIQKTKEIGTAIEGYFNKAEQVISKLKRVKENGRKIDEKTNRSWDELQISLSIFNEAKKSWGDVFSSVSKDHKKLSESIASIDFISDALKDIQNSNFAIIQSMLGDNYNLVSYQRSDMNIEAFLRDAEDRMIAINISPERHIEEGILMELDLSDFDEEGEHDHCDFELNNVLDTLTELGILRKTRTEHPHRKSFGELNIKTKDKKKSMAKQREQRIQVT